MEKVFSQFKFIKCFFCGKNYNKLQLIEMNNKTILINGEEMSYKNLILDVLMFEIDDIQKNYICNDCNDKLLSFHFFKRDTKKYDNFLGRYLQKLEVLSKAEKFLDKSESLAGPKIIEDNCKFTISLQDEFIEEDIIEQKRHIKEEMEVVDAGEDEELIFESKEDLQEEEVAKEQQTDEDIAEELNWFRQGTTSNDIKRRNQHQKIKEAPEYKFIIATDCDAAWECPYCGDDVSFTTFESFENHLKHNHSDQNEEFSTKIERLDEQDIEVTAEEFILTEFDETPPIKKRKVNTLNDLNEEQVNWVRKQVAAGETEGKNKFFRCNVCSSVLSTQASLTRHLRDVHVLQKNNDKTSLKQEVGRSKLTVCGETIWKCQRCEKDQIYKSAQAFKLHLRMKHIRATKVDTAFVAACKTLIHEPEGLREAWKCPTCSRIFKHRDTLRNHIKKEHPDIDEEEARMRMEAEEKAASFSASESPNVISRIEQKLMDKGITKSHNFCEECGLKFNISKQHLKPKIHRECHEVFRILAPQCISYKCEPCRMILNSEASYSHHVMVHDHPENILPIDADGLSQIGASTYKIPKGDADDAVDEASWKCGHCPVRYFDENDCVAHIMLLHTSSLYCFLDNREFTGSTGMSKYLQHMKNKHPELFPDLTYPCGGCKLEFQSVYEKLAHQKLCLSKKFECDHCDKRFQNKYQLVSHILYELGLSGVSCEFCGKRCKTMSDLKIHQNVHSQARPYECSLCMKTFKTPGARSSHMESHNGGLDCEVCGIKLSNRTVYQRHKKFLHNQDFRVNQLEKNVCTLCGKSFLRSFHFKQHMKQQHGIQQV